MRKLTTSVPADEATHEENEGEEEVDGGRHQTELADALTEVEGPGVHRPLAAVAVGQLTLGHPRFDRNPELVGGLLSEPGAARPC